MVVLEDADADDPRREIELRFAANEALLGLLARRDVEKQAHLAPGAAIRIVEEAAVRLDPHDVAGVGADDSILGSVRRVLALGAIDLGQHALEVLGMYT